MFFCSLSSCLVRLAFIRFASSRLVSITRCPHPLHSNPISAPRRITFHSYEPHGCGFRRRKWSFSCKSGSMAKIIPPCHKATSSSGFVNHVHVNMSGSCSLRRPRRRVSTGSTCQIYSQNAAAPQECFAKDGGLSQYTDNLCVHTVNPL